MIKKELRALGIILGGVVISSFVFFSQDTFAIDETVTLTISSSSMTFPLMDNTPVTRSLDISVGTENEAGYILSFNVNNDFNELKHENTSIFESIPSIEGSMTLASFPTNGWGYTTDEGSSAIYHEMPFSMTALYESEGAGVDTVGFTVSVKAAADATPGTYYNSLLFTAIGKIYLEPEILPFGGITTMQEMTPEYCAMAEIGDVTQLTDTRDGKTYWIARFKDGLCWMTQNLDLTLSTNTALTPNDSDVASNWTPSNSTGNWSWNPNPVNSMNYGSNYIANGTASSTKSTAGLAADALEWHYIQGTFYNFYAASAGGNVVNNVATQSVCPKGWKLPLGNTAEGSWAYLSTKGSFTSASISQSPYFLNHAGSFYGSVSNLGSDGAYWSATIVNGQVSALVFGSGWIGIQNNLQYTGGASVRCVVR